MYPSTQKDEHFSQVVVLPPIPKLDLPPIPPITDSYLKDMAFTHSSLTGAFRSQSNSLFATENQPVFDYEKLEHVGDALLEAVAVTLAHELFPNFRQGSATVMRSHLVSNAILAQISQQYGLPQQIKCEPSMRHTLRRNEKVQASVFEAYIAAAYYSYLGDQIPSITKNQDMKQQNYSSDNSSPSSSISSVNREDDQSDLPQNPKKRKMEHGIIEEINGNTEPLNRNSSDDDADIYCIDLMFRLMDEELSEIKQDTSVHLDNSSENSASKDEVEHLKTRGDAYNYLFDWLSQVLEPVAYFVVEELKVEAKRIKNSPTGKAKSQYEIPEEWKKEDIKAQGGKTALHEYFRDPNMPTYITSRMAGNPATAPWKVVCTAIDKSGKTWTAEAIRMTKQAASNLAAWKVCVAVGLIEEDDE
ncbi:uncharacterized protein L201_003435 [Kwoniella dendrophila CBS 6074]|uniref:RNase III domain-containing protein n=1 Tax=Kwoniella dendrophila CBS 6074 TaxID=1295534 RepID=A0AAX4JUP0_9TREE